MSSASEVWATAPPLAPEGTAGGHTRSGKWVHGVFLFTSQCEFVKTSDWFRVVITGQTFTVRNENGQKQVYFGGKPIKKLQFTNYYESVKHISASALGQNSTNEGQSETGLCLFWVFCSEKD